jgi:arylsulfatase A-like enzyme
VSPVPFLTALSFGYRELQQKGNLPKLAKVQAMKPLRAIVLAAAVAILSYFVLRYEFYHSKWLVIIPLFFRTHVVLPLTNPIYRNKPVTWKAGSRRGSKKGGKAPPNVLLIIADDLGINDLSGGCGVKTPHIDSIMHNGLAFTQVYSGHATCAPSRASLLTGRFPTRFGHEFTPGPKGVARILALRTEGELRHPILHLDSLSKLPPFKNMSLPLNETLLPHAMQQSGYDTYLLGKWDAGREPPYTPIDRGYNESLNFFVGASQYQRDFHPDLVNGYGDKFDDFLRLICRFYVSHNNGHFFQPDKYMTDYLSEQASNLIKSRTAGGGDDEQVAPFFITLAYNAPHNPFQAMRADYEDAEVQQLPTHMERVYAGMIKALDRGVGTVLQALKDSGQYENTVVIFTSDNGGAHYANLPQLNAPYRGWKATFFEGGIRVPMFMQWPARIQPLQGAAADVQDADVCRTYANRSAHAGVQCGYRVVEDVVSHVDLFTSLVSLANTDPASATAHRLDGLNFFDLVKAQGGWVGEDGADDASTSDTNSEASALSGQNAVEQSRSRVLYWRAGHYSAVRVGDWKFQISQRPDKVWLYDLHNDPTEWRNLAEEVGVTNRASLEALRSNGTVGTDADDSKMATAEHERITSELLRVYAAFEQEDAEQVPPSWPCASETPVFVDRVIGEKDEPTDEYIYWSN